MVIQVLKHLSFLEVDLASFVFDLKRVCNSAQVQAETRGKEAAPVLPRCGWPWAARERMRSGERERERYAAEFIFNIVNT